MVGSNCLHRMQEDPTFDVIGTHYSFATNDTEYFDVFDQSKTTFDIRAFSPDAVVHTGALTHVDYCETHEDESYRHTVASTEAAIALANDFGARFVYISSDYVFDGEDGPYDENAETHPISVYGRHKLLAEKMVREQCENYLILRITNVYGSEIRGKNFVAFLAKTAEAEEEKTLRLPVDQFATPINAADIAKVLVALLNDNKQGIYNIASDEYLSRVELAERVLKHFPGHKVKVEAIRTEDLGQAAPRPLFGGLKNNKIKGEYPKMDFSTVEEYVEEEYGT